MASYALSTNLYSFAQIRAEPPFFGWPEGTGKAEVIKQLSQGDLIIPKFAASAHYVGIEGDPEWQRRYCESIGADYEVLVEEYEAVISSGEGAVPFLLRVTGQLPADDRPAGAAWLR